MNTAGTLRYGNAIVIYIFYLGQGLKLKKTDEGISMEAFEALKLFKALISANSLNLISVISVNSANSLKFISADSLKSEISAHTLSPANALNLVSVDLFFDSLLFNVLPRDSNVVEIS